MKLCAYILTFRPIGIKFGTRNTHKKVMCECDSRENGTVTTTQSVREFLHVLSTFAGLSGQAV